MPLPGGAAAAGTASKLYRIAKPLFNVTKVSKRYDYTKLARLGPNKGSSRLLGQNLEKVGKYGTRVNGKLTDDAAHLVAKNAKHARNSRAILKKYGIDIDNEVNGKWLPHGKNTSKYPNPLGKATHQSTHSKKFHSALEQMLRRANSQKDCEKILRYVAQQLEKGPWPR